MSRRAMGLCLVGAALAILASRNVAHAPPPSDARSQAPQSPERPGPSVGRPSPERSPESQEHRDDADAEQSTSAPAVAVQDQKESATGNGGTPEAEQHQKEDLIAQQTMAEAALQMLQLTKAQIGLGILGAAGLFLTLWYNIRATNAAVRTAEANRAWMSLSQTNVAERQIGEQTVLVIAMQWTNSGLSPALDCRILGTHKPVGKTENIPVFKRPNAADAATIAPIGKDQIVIANPITIAEDECRRFLSHEARIFLYCLVLYRDVYPKTPERHTEFCAELRYVGDSQKPDVKNFVLVPSGKQNRAN
jgi:hypothetical protein